jgi:hypothetical protein
MTLFQMCTLHCVKRDDMLIIRLIFTGYQPRQFSVLNRRFEDHLGHHHHRSLMMMMMTEMVLETSIQYKHLMRLIAREDFIEFSLRESLRTYIMLITYEEQVKDLEGGRGGY